jgi:outer membrane murein-binding lipoprotein Lpp
MNREEFIVSAAIILFLAFLLGWLSRWLLQRLNMVSEKDLNQFNKISAALHEAEENNEKARVRELELNKKVSQLEAELEAAMDGLRAARLETEELKSASSEKKR